MSLEMAHKVILPPKKNYIPQFLKQRDINSYYYSLCNGASLYAPCSFLLIWAPMALAYLLVAISGPKKVSNPGSNPLGPWREATRAFVGRGGRTRNSNEGTDTLVLYLYYNHSTVMLQLSSFVGP
jgi:hypothetical protein